MNSALKQANFQLPEDLLNELRETIAKGEMSRFVSEALRRELKRLRQLRAIDESFGAWRGGEHPELSGGVEHFVRDLRKSTRNQRTDASDRR